MVSTAHVPTDAFRPRDVRPVVAVTMSPLRRFFGVIVRPDTFRNITYLLLGLPLGTAWFTAMVTGVSVAASMLVVALVGIPMLLAMWYLSRMSANVERAVANRLLHQQIPYAPVASHHRGNVWVRLRAMSREQDRWREAGFLMLRFPVGIATFTAVAVALATPFWVAWAPFQARLADHPFGNWALSSEMEEIAMSGWSWFCVPAGLLLLFVAFHALNGLARACSRWNTSWLGNDA
ncbi:MAG: hypothetical protein JJLCMIEE_02060 [Acidimicrobiales bacterium]|nr:hypothetical protein [Acidimicrobiales bacterium]